MSFTALVLTIVLVSVSATQARYHSKVFGGYIAEKNEFLHQTAIAVNVFGFNEVFCSGSLISQRFIITAGHCQETFSSFFNVYVMVGSKDITKDGYWYKIESAFAHPQWKKDELEYDVLLLQTAEKVKLIPDLVELVKLPEKHTYYPEVGDKVWTCGWGLETPQKRSTILKKIDMIVVSEKDCNRVWGPNIEKRICVFSKQKGWGTCNGDSGGGLIYDGYLIGILSYGTQECNMNEPEVYSDIHVYLDWINSVMKKSMQRLRHTKRTKQ